MKQLVHVLTAQIERLIKNSARKTIIIRLECMDDPRVYWMVCDHLSKLPEISVFIAKLSREKYFTFTKEARPEWALSLQNLHQGGNPMYSDSISDLYSEKSYVDFGNAITKWRNESASLEAEKTSLVLLMGTEAAPDTGGLADTSFVISPKEIIADLSADYSSWFQNVLHQNNIESQDCSTAIHTLYKVIFANTNIDIFKLSSFVDQINPLTFNSSQDLINYICETLSTTWGIPSLKNPTFVPKVSGLAKGKMASGKIIERAIRFIERADDIPSESRLNGQEEQFKKYVEKRTADESEPFDPFAPFPKDAPVFPSFYDFHDCYFEFVRGKNIEENRSLLLKTDYAIVADILGIDVSNRKVAKKVPPVSGEPVEAYTRIILDAINRYHEDTEHIPTSFTFRVDSISLSNCTEDQKDSAFRPISSFLGGILDFFNDSALDYNGELLKFSYDELDPFDFSNYVEISDKIKCTGKWGDPCKIHFHVLVSSDVAPKSYAYTWVFSPYCAWNNAFTYLDHVLLDHGESYGLPTMVTCDNIQDYLSCESEEEFYAQLEQLRATVLEDQHRAEIRRYFRDCEARSYFELLCDHFREFALALTSHGLFNSLGKLRNAVNTYSALMKWIHGNYGRLNDLQREKINLLANCFVITSNKAILSDGNMGEVIIPAYNPVVLEKLDSKQLFLRAGAAELIKKVIGGLKQKDAMQMLARYVELSEITQGVDSIHQGSSHYLTCKKMWEYYGVYYSKQIEGELLSGNTYGMSIVTDDEDASAMLKSTPMSNIIVRNVMDYIRTFPSRMDGINIAFIAPDDIQHIVSAIHVIAKTIEDSDDTATINLNLICINSRKNSGAYLRRWLDSYFGDERSVKVNTFLQNITIKNISDTECLKDILNNHDLCFNYNILTQSGLSFSPADSREIDIHQAKFPMAIIPDTVSATSGRQRNVNISQFQFLTSKQQTQVSHIIGYPDSKEGIYRAYLTLKLSDIEMQIIEISHACCRWVVCIDPVIDRRMLDDHGKKIIGFTTGEGSYGELNVTVSARKDVLSDIKQFLYKRLGEKFSTWDKERLSKAAAYCVDSLSRYMDGSRILKALNPYDYEIHNYLAYLLSLQMLGLSEPHNECFVRELISMDSYRHWFDGDEDNIRPDFLLIEIPATAQNLDPTEKLYLKAKIVECKMGNRNPLQIDKAKTQLEKGLRTLARKWREGDPDPMHRYWLNQLYRAIIFSPINLDNTSEEYIALRNKIYSILDDNIEIDWTAEVFAFWLDSDEAELDSWELPSDVPDELCAEGITVAPLKCNACGQMFIQRMLLPPEERQAHFDYIDQREDSVPVENEEENGEENEEETEEREERNSPANTLITLDEAILLLDLLIKEGQLGWSRSMTADEASKALRALKAASGGAVPESFRTAGGLSGRLRQLSGTFQSGISSTTVFEEVVKLYREDQVHYKERLAYLLSQIQGSSSHIETQAERKPKPGETIPQESSVYAPFLSLLSDGNEHTRQSCLSWFGDYFHISSEDRTIVFESNSHLKWETVFDWVITKFRSNGLLANSSVAVFHITELGKELNEVLHAYEYDGEKFFTILDKVRETKRVKLEQENVDLGRHDEQKPEETTIANEVDSEKALHRLAKKTSLKEVRLLLGENLRTHEKYYWEFGNKELNNRHLLINGNSGCGKTYCIQTLLMEAALQGVSSVVFDYTGGFANSKLDPVFKQALGEKIHQRVVLKDKIPVNPFIKHEIQIDEDIFIPEENAHVADKIAEIFKSVYSLGDQQRSAVYSAVLSGLKIYGDKMSFPIMVQELENIGTNYAKTVISKIQAFSDFNPFSSGEAFDWTDIRDSDGMVYVFQLAGYGREIQVLLTELLLWDIWSFCVKNGDESKPFVLVMDEAQNLSHGEKSPSAKILTEGRKFGLSGWYATQFMKPQLTDDEIQRLQQAGQKLYFCPPDDGVLTVARNIDITSAGAKEWSEKLKRLKKGECVTCGNMVRNDRWVKYEPSIIKVTSLQARLEDD